MTDLVLEPLSETQLRRGVRLAALMATTLPPFVGGTVVSLMGLYPFPAFFRIFTAWFVLLYVGVAVFAAQSWASGMIAFLAALPGRDAGGAASTVHRRLRTLPWLLLAAVTVYSMGGVFIADVTLESLGLARYDRSDHLLHQIGLVPVVLVTVFPVYLFLLDRVGRFLAPRGIGAVATTLRGKIVLLGIVTPLLVDSVLVGSYVVRTGRFGWDTLALWLSLLAVAAGGTWLVWQSVRRGLAPLQAFVATPAGSTAPGRTRAALVPQSLDELGALTARFGELLEREEKSALLADAVVDQAGALVLALDREGRIVRFNQACERLSGYAFHEVQGRFPWDTVLPSEDAETIRREAFDALVRRPKAVAGQYTNDWLAKSGDRHRIEWSNTLIHDADGEMAFMVSVGVDVTERHRLEQELRLNQARLTKAQRIARVGSWELDLRDGRLLWTDEVFMLFGMDASGFAPSYEAFLNAIHPEDRAAVDAAYTQSLRDRAPYQIVHRLRMPDGRVKWVEERCDTDFAEDGTPLVSRGTIQDVTERMEAEAQIRAALEEKQTLLREVHHRLKNNLQVVSSLLYFQAKNVLDPTAQASLAEARERLRSIALVHEKLYAAGDLASVDFADYVRTLVSQLVDGRQGPTAAGRTTVETVPLKLPVELASPAGMVLVELITNVMKHAYPPGMSGPCAVRVEQDDDVVVLSVSDEGVGLPHGFDSDTATGFGWTLIRALTEQLDGQVALGSDGGTTVKVSFPVPAWGGSAEAAT